MTMESDSESVDKLGLIALAEAALDDAGRFRDWRMLEKGCTLLCAQFRRHLPSERRSRALATPSIPITISVCT